MKQNLSIENSLVQRNGRQALNGHKGRTLWFTGLSGSGKSTLARSLEQELHSRGIRTYLLDGDNLRRGLNRDLGFSDEDREENIRRASEVCRLMVEAGMVVLAAFISPLASQRAMAKKIIGEQDFEEIFIFCPLEVCVKRDPKGFYAKANRGEIKDYTGIKSAFEEPENPDLKIDTGEQTQKQCLETLLKFYGN